MGMPTLQELFGNLEDHEMELKRYSKNDEGKRRKSLTLKATINIKDEDNDSKSLQETNEDNEIALLTRKYQRILRARKDYGRKKKTTQKNQKQK